MCPFVETIRVEQGVLLHIDYHNQRMNDTRSAFWPNAKPLDLNHFLLPPTAEEVVKCRVVYSDIIEEISYDPYSIRPVRSLRIVYSDTINYTYKSTDREALNQLYQQRDTKDDVLIIKNGYITDTSIANVALFDGTHWFTPKHPLLKGTQRAQLLQRGIIQEKEITVEELFSFAQMTIFNAMIPFQSLVLDVNSALISY